MRRLLAKIGVANFLKVIVIIGISKDGMWGLQLLFSDAIMKITAMYYISEFFKINNVLLGVLMLISAVLAYMGITVWDYHHSNKSIYALALQQFLLLMSAMGGLISSVQGHYPDGYVPFKESYFKSSMFIFGDQGVHIFIAVVHFILMFQFYKNYRLWSHRA